MKCYDLACGVRTMTQEVKYFFPTLSSEAIFFIYQLSEYLEMRKIAHVKEPTNQAHFLDFHRLSQSYPVSKSNMHPRTEISATVTVNPRIPHYLCLVSDNLRQTQHEKSPCLQLRTVDTAFEGSPLNAPSQVLVTPLLRSDVALKIFVPPVMNRLQSSNLDRRYTSWRGVYRALLRNCW